jgi:hypothetical protein
MHAVSNYGGLALWQTALGDSILGYVAPMLKLLLGWGLALEEALVDEIDVVHHVFGHLCLSRCAVHRRQFRRRRLNSQIVSVPDKKMHLDDTVLYVCTDGPSEANRFIV